MEKIQASNCVVFIDDQTVEIRKVKCPSLPTVIFVSSLITLISLVLGVVFTITLYNPETGLNTFSIVLLFVGVLFLGFTLFVIKRRKKSNSLSCEKLDKICSIDLSSRALIDANEQKICSIDDVRLIKKMQVTSSSPKLLIEHENGQVEIARGNPFAGGVEPIYDCLSEYISKK